MDLHQVSWLDFKARKALMAFSEALKLPAMRRRPEHVA